MVGSRVLEMDSTTSILIGRCGGHWDCCLISLIWCSRYCCCVDYIWTCSRVSSSISNGSSSSVANVSSSSVANVSSSSVTSGLDISSSAGNIFFSLWVVNNLSLNWEILNSFPSSFNWFIFYNSLLNFLRNIFDLSLNSIIISNSSFNWNLNNSSNLLILSNLSFEWNSFYSFDLIIFDMFSFKRNIFDSAFDWNFFSDWSMSNSWSCISSISISCCISCCSISSCYWAWYVGSLVGRWGSNISCCSSVGLGWATQISSSWSANICSSSSRTSYIISTNKSRSRNLSLSNSISCRSNSRSTNISWTNWAASCCNVLSCGMLLNSTSRIDNYVKWYVLPE